MGAAISQPFQCKFFLSYSPLDVHNYRQFPTLPSKFVPLVSPRTITWEGLDLEFIGQIQVVRGIQFSIIVFFFPSHDGGSIDRGCHFLCMYKR